MPSLDVRLRLVRKLPQPAQIAALESALAVAGSTEGGEIALQLLDIATHEKPFLTDDRSGGFFRRRRKPAQAIRPLLALLRGWSILGEDERAAAVAIAGHNIGAVLELMVDDRSFAHRLAAAAITASHPTAEAIPILSRLILDSDDDVQSAAEAAIEKISSSHAGLDPHTAGALDRLLAETGRSFSDHRRPGVIAAIASQLDRPGPRLSQWLLDEHQAGLLALRGLLRRDQSPRSAQAAIGLLDHPTLRGAARTRLENLTTPESRNAALSRWPALLNPVCARPSPICAARISCSRMTARSRAWTPRLGSGFASGPMRCVCVRPIVCACSQGSPSERIRAPHPLRSGVLRRCQGPTPRRGAGYSSQPAPGMRGAPLLPHRR